MLLNRLLTEYTCQNLALSIASDIHFQMRRRNFHAFIGQTQDEKTLEYTRMLG